jgi:hypothetical protein
MGEEHTVWDMTNAPEHEQRQALAVLSGDESWTERLTPQQRITVARKRLTSASADVRQTIVEWGSDVHRAATDISLNKLMEAHLHITEAINALNSAQSHTVEE